MNRLSRAGLAAATLAVSLWTAGGAALAVPVRAASPTFGTPTADSTLLGPTNFHTTITSDTQPQEVELLLNLPGQAYTYVIGAHVTGGNGTWTADATDPGHFLPNSLLTYQFRLTDSSGAMVVGPQAQLLTVDDRFQWKTVTGKVVRLHWNGGDATFGQRALDIGETAIDNASKLLGVTETDPIDFFIYDDEKAFRDALGPGTRENVAGTAVAENRTMYAYLLPSQIDSDFVHILVTHELTHLVFDTATHNIYDHPAHWLNEGIAVYLSEGFSARWQGDMQQAEADGGLIPLQGMNHVFGAGDQRFELGYAEGVSAVDFFVKTYTEPKLWALVRSYSNGLSDDDAFKQAIGLDVPGFNAAWMKSLGVPVPTEFGPQPGPTGALPPEWQGLPPASPASTAPGATQTASSGGIRPTPRPTDQPTNQPGSGGQRFELVFGGAGLIAVLVIIALVVMVSRRRRPPPGAQWWPGPPPGDDWVAGPPTLPPPPPPPGP